MFDIKWIRENPEAFDAGLARRGIEPKSAEIIALDEQRRSHVGKVQEAQQRRNAASKEIGAAMGKGDKEKAEALKEEVGELKNFLSEAEETERQLTRALSDALSVIPNLPLENVPFGVDEEGNELYREWGNVPEFGFAPKEHFEIAAVSDGNRPGMDFDRAARLSGSRFVVLSGEIARLERAIGQFMLDIHVNEHGYTEVQPPLLVNDATMYGTGQLPKFKSDLFRAEIGSLEELLEELFEEFVPRTLHGFATMNTDAIPPIDPDIGKPEWEFDEKRRIEFLSQFGANLEKKWLIPTAEVPLTNLVRDEILDKKDLPLRMTALTYCFRSEAGSAGRDTRGMLRQHQFNKVELVSITDKDSSLDELERMLGCAENTLQALGLHYRIMTLCTGDMGFGARKTYDIEVWLPGQNAYREISSCSVCGDFQARRMNARYREGEKELHHVHTLNGSGVAVGRMLIAVLENYQNADGTVRIPKSLQPYMGGKTVIGEKAGN